MQKHLDSWLEEDWKEGTEGFEEKETKKFTPTKEKEAANEAKGEQNTSDEDDSFTLQHYVDKIKYYNEHKKSSGPSHVEELNKMPVIGE